MAPGYGGGGADIDSGPRVTHKTNYAAAADSDAVTAHNPQSYVQSGDILIPGAGFQANEKEDRTVAGAVSSFR